MTLLQQLEQAVYGSSNQQQCAVELLHRIVSNFDLNDAANAEQQSYYARLANVIAALLQDATYQMSLSDYHLLCASHKSIMAVFACTDYQNADHIISGLADIRNINSISFTDQNTLMKCLLCYSLSSNYDFDLSQLAQQFPELVAPLLLGLLSYNIYSRQNIENKLNKILNTDWSALHSVVPSLPMLLTMSSAWMNCSYACHPSKHRIKKDLNTMIKNALRARGWQTAPQAGDPRLSTDDKPLILIPFEIFNSKHAMFRCFARAIGSLKNNFRVVAVSPESNIDAEAEELFPEIIKFDAAATMLDLSELLQQVYAYKPDIVYYPSLGMANYTLLMANLRLAPIQCFTLGHPATSYIDTIEHVIVQEQDFTDVDVYSEKVILTGNDTSPTINQVRRHITSPGQQRDQKILRIAVTSKHMKISYRFLACCRQIFNRLQQQNVSVEFHFFPGATGRLFEFIRHEIQQALPGSQIWPTTDYQQYIQRMDQCVMRLGTFPFGGANTNMDCFGLGIPFIVMNGKQPHARSDVAQLEQAGLPQWLIAENEQQYIEAAVRLAANDSERQRISEQMLDLDNHEFFYQSAAAGDMQFAKTLGWLCKQHKQLQKTEQRLWALADQQ